MLTLILALACSSDDADPAGAGPTDGVADPTEEPTEVTGDDPPLAGCAATENTLRFACTATVSTASEAAWEVKEGDTVVRTFTTATGTDHEVVLWGLAPETDHTWTVRTDGGSASGTLTTGALPDELADLSLTVTGTAAAVQALALPAQCGSSTFALVVDAAGRVVWYQLVSATAGPGAGLTAYAWTDRDTFVYVTAGDTVTEIDASGASLWTASGFDRPLHHAVYRGGDFVYALNAAEHDGKVVDGFYVLQDGVTIAEWDLADHVAVVGGDGVADPFWDMEFPGSEDWSHANSIWSDGVAGYVSLRWQDAVLKLDADPASASFGALEWILTGTTDSDLPTDFTWTDGGSFDGQHHATPIDGGISVFDNRAGSLDSRAVTLTLDEGALTVRESASWSLGRHCEIQGGAFATAGGGMVSTCATDGYVAEFVSAVAEPVWTLDASCGVAAGGPATLAKAFPVALH